MARIELVVDTGAGEELVVETFPAGPAGYAAALLAKGRIQDDMERDAGDVSLFEDVWLRTV